MARAARRSRRYTLVGGAALIVSLVAPSCSDEGTSSGTGANDVTTTSAPEATTAPAATDAGTGTSVEHRGNGPVAIDDDGTTHVQHDRMQDGLAAVPAAELTDADRAGLLYLRESEKLSRDVSMAMYDAWALPVFSSVGDAEQTHFDAVALLLQRYDLADPADGNEPGVFQDETLQAHFDQLVEQGAASSTAGLSAGAAVAELSITDLRTHATDAPDIALVLENLELASRNHLRVFVEALAASGVAYTPAYLSQAEFDAIVAAPMETVTTG